MLLEPLRELREHDARGGRTWAGVGQEIEGRVIACVVNGNREELQPRIFVAVFRIEGQPAERENGAGWDGQGLELVVVKPLRAHVAEPGVVKQCGLGLATFHCRKEDILNESLGTIVAP